MRYLIQFADKTTKRVTQEEGKEALLRWADGRPIMIRGAGFAHHLISAIRPINREWYSDDYVVLESRGEDLKQIAEPTAQLADFNG